MAITKIRAEQQVSQSSITEAQLSGSLAGHGLGGADGLPLSVTASAIHGGVVSGSSQVILNAADSSSYNTNYIDEGSSNKYYTDARVQAELTASNVFSSSRQTVLWQADSGSYTTDFITEGSTNEYYTDARVSNYLSSSIIVSQSEQLDYDLIGQPNEGEIISQSGQIDYDLITQPDNGAIVSMSGQIVLNAADSGSYNTSYIPEGTNLYYTDARVSSFVSGSPFFTASEQIDYDEITQPGVGEIISQSGQITLQQADSSSYSTTYVDEGTNLYYTDARVLEELYQQGIVSGAAQITGSAIDAEFKDITAVNVSASAVISASSFYGQFIEISSSIEFSSGSTIFGDDAADSHEFTGSVDIEGALTVSGAVSMDDNVVLGASSSDDINFVGRVSSSIIPNRTNGIDLGSSTLKWKDLYVSGTAHIDILSASGFQIGGSSGGGNAGEFNSISASTLEVDSDAYIARGFISGGNLENVTIGANTATSGTFTTATIGYGDFESIDIDNGTIDDTIIGAGTPASGTFTTASANSLIGDTGSIGSTINIGKVSNASGHSQTATYEGFFSSLFGESKTLGYALNEISKTINLITPSQAPLLSSAGISIVKSGGSTYSGKWSNSLPASAWDSVTAGGSVTNLTDATTFDVDITTDGTTNAGVNPDNFIHGGLYSDWQSDLITGILKADLRFGQTDSYHMLDFSGLGGGATSISTASADTRVTYLRMDTAQGFGGPANNFWFMSDIDMRLARASSYTGSISASFTADFGSNGRTIGTSPIYKVSSTETALEATISNANMTVGNPQYRWLSGHRAYDDNTEFTASFRGTNFANPIFKSPLTTGLASTHFTGDDNKNYNSSGMSFLSGETIPNWNDTLIASYSIVLSTNNSNVSPSTDSQSAYTDTVTLENWNGQDATHTFTYGEYPYNGGFSSDSDADADDSGNAEQFESETHRIKIVGAGADIIKFNQVAFVSTAPLTFADLQVKHGSSNGYLVNPESAHSNQRGWYQAGGALARSGASLTSQYAQGNYYCRKLDTNSKNQTNSVTIHLDHSDTITGLDDYLVPFDDNTSNKISIGIILEQVTDGSHTLASGYTDDIIFDAGYTDSGDTGRTHTLPYGNIAQTRNVNLYGVQSAITSTSDYRQSVTVSFPSNDGCFIGNGYDAILVIRYTGASSTFHPIMKLGIEY